MKKNKLQPGPSPAFSAAAARRWCSARQGLPGLQRGGAWERRDRGTPTLVAVRVEEGRKRLAGANGGEDVRVAGIVGEGGLGVGERGAHEHRESVRMLLG